MTEEFDFEETRRKFPQHWNEDGRPALGSLWRARSYPHLRVSVMGNDKRHVSALVYWDADLEGLKLLFTYETTERWNIDKDHVVYGSPGIDRERHWQDEGESLIVEFDRAKFGSSDTWHIGREGVNLPFFEPIRRPPDDD